MTTHTPGTSLVVLFTPPPTPNGGLHVGHACGPYLRADLHRRLLRLTGSNAVHLSHIDNFQTYVQRKALEGGRTAEDLRSEMSARICSDFDSLGIYFDGMLDNTTSEYAQYFQSCLDALLRTTGIRIGREFVGDDARYSAAEAYVSGFCPHCLQRASANVCEACGQPLLLADLLSPSDDIGGGEFVEIFDEKPNMLAIGAEELVWLRTWAADCAIDDDFVKTLLSRLRPHEVTVTLRSPYGFETSPGRAINAWIEIFFAHLYSLGEQLGASPGMLFNDLRNLVSQRSGEYSVQYYFGVDNSYYYAALFPLLAHMLGLDSMLPEALNANRFLKHSGKKMSSSRNNALWAEDLRGIQSSAAVRAGLARQCPEGSELEFRADDMQRADEWTVEAVEGAWYDCLPGTPAGAVFYDLIGELVLPGRFSVAHLVGTLDRVEAYRNSGHATYAEVAELSELMGRLRADLDI